MFIIGGYLPTDEEVKQNLKEISDRIDNWPYPAYAMDFSWRALDSNILNLKIFNLPLKLRKELQNSKLNVLIFPFLPKEQFPVIVQKGEDKDNLKPFQVAQIAAFKTETHQYQNESWYKKLIQSLMQFKDFRILWPKINQKDYHKKLLDYEYKTIMGEYNGQKKTLHFHIFTAKLIADPRFQIVLYYPANQKTFSSINQISIDLP